jgi:hypothetical protein
MITKQLVNLKIFTQPINVNVQSFGHSARREKAKGIMYNTGAVGGLYDFFASVDSVKVLVTQDKWDKTKSLLAALTCELAEGDWLNFNFLESARGFMIYVSRTYRPMIHFLLGIHNTFDSWWPNRREDGWRQNRLIISIEGHEDEAAPDLGQSAVLPPSTVKAAKRVLTMLTDLDVPPLQRLRGSSKLKVWFWLDHRIRRGDQIQTQPVV